MQGRWLPRLAVLALSLAPTAWFFLTNPLAWPLLQTGTAGVAARIEAQMDRAMSDGTLERRLSAAVEAEDAPTADRLYKLAEGSGHGLPATLATDAEKLIGADGSWLETSVSCAGCAYDITTCRSIAEIAACAIPVEITPLGDANALRRQAQNAVTGAEVDQIETGLAFVGLGASAAVVLTGGSSALVKAGVTGTRLARRMDALTSSFAQVLSETADMPVNWASLDDFALRRVSLDAVTDTVKLRRLAGMAEDIGQVYMATSLADTLLLMRHVDSGADLSRLVRVTDATGPRSLEAFALLGKSRVFRALDEVGTLLRFGAALTISLILQLAFWLARRLLRAGWRRPQPAR